MMKSAVETFRASVVVLALVNAIVLVLDRTHNLRWWLYPGVMLLALGAFNLQRFVRLLASTHSK
jgi:hypothetical protein